MLVHQKVAEVIQLVPAGRVGRPRKDELVAPPARIGFWGPKFERDVEVLFIEPLLNKLGYGGQNCRRRPTIELATEGINVTIKPNYSFGGPSRISMVLESKLHLHNFREFSLAYRQAKRYGQLLDCRVVVTCALEGVWIFPRVGDEFSEFAHVNWIQLHDKQVFDEVATLIGPKAILTSSTVPVSHW